MSLVIKILGELMADEEVYIEEFTLDTDANGRSHLVTTSEIAKAKRFADFEEAVGFWKQQSKRVPLRPDGKPNRPLTAFSITFEQVGFTCPKCGMTSHNQQDEVERYCGNCHQFFPVTS